MGMNLSRLQEGMNLSRLQERVEDGGAWPAAVREVTKRHDLSTAKRQRVLDLVSYSGDQGAPQARCLKVCFWHTSSHQTVPTVLSFCDF